MSSIGEGQTQSSRELSGGMYLKTGDPGLTGGGTYSGGTETEGTMAQYENIFGPAGRDIKLDQQRHKRHQRWHLPDALKGHNQYLTDRVDGLITDATNSPFTRNILPYVYLENPDQKLKWNVYSFDEGIASRVPYEAAARVLPQTKRSFAGYTVRQGLAIAMEHNFMVSAAGRENFKNQLTQLVGSIQLTNDLDVHVALLSAPSYQKHMNEKYYDNTKTTAQICRQYIDLFGILQKVPNAMDILIEDAKSNLQTWGSQPPTFCLCNSALTSQLTMLPEKTNFVTNGPDGLKRLAEGPNLASYRGLQIIPSRKFSMDAGTAPRDLLRRRVRVAEYYRIPWKPENVNRTYEFYDQSRDSMFSMSWSDLLQKSRLAGADEPSQYDESQSISGPWQYNSTRKENIPAYQIITFAVRNYEYGLCLKGRMAKFSADESSSVYLMLDGYMNSSNDAHYTNKKTLNWDQCVELSPTVKYENKTITGINYSALDGIHQHEGLTSNKQMDVLAEQSELFGRGIFNDPLSGIYNRNSENRISNNFASLHNHGTRHDFEKHWMVVYFFDELEKLYEASCHGSNSEMINTWNSRGDALANTPMKDLLGLGENAITPLFNEAVSSVGMDLEYAYSEVQDITGNVPGGPRHHVKDAADLATARRNYIVQNDLSACNHEWRHVLLSLDGSMTSDAVSGFASITSIINVLKKTFELCKKSNLMTDLINANADAITAKAQLQGGVTTFLYDNTATNIPIQQRMPTWTDTSYDEHPNLFFLWLICIDKTALIGVLNTMARNANDMFTDNEKTIFTAMNDRGTPDLLQPWATVLAHLFASQIGPAHYSKAKHSADILRLVHTLQKKFDVSNIAWNGLSNTQRRHRIMIDTMITASMAFLNYRRRLQKMTHDAAKTQGKHVYHHDALQLVLKQLQYTTLTDACTLPIFQAVITHEEGVDVPQYRAFGLTATSSKYSRPLMSAMPAGTAGTITTVIPGGMTTVSYFSAIHDEFKKHMLSASSHIQMTHNIVMQTSRTAGANITHFPNYHISRCNALQDDDREKSASSQNNGTWIVQQLAAMMPLSNDVCKKMMGIQEIDKIALIQCAEMLTGTTDANRTWLAYPTHEIRATFANDNNYDSFGPIGALGASTDTLHWAHHEYSTNLMQTFMALFNPSPYVREKNATETFIPLHHKQALMQAFANAIQNNTTMTTELETILGHLFADRDEQVAFCGAQANEKMAFVPQTADSQMDYKKQLEQRVSWNEVPFCYDFESEKRDGEDVVDYTGRLQNVIIYDVHRGGAKSGDEVRYWAHQQGILNLRAPMRSFDCVSPESVNSHTPGKIHNNLNSAAESAILFCSNINNWEEFWKHLVLVWVSRFFRASTRFVDDGKGMMAPVRVPGAAGGGGGGGGCKYVPNGMHLMHGPRLPEFGRDPSQPDRVGEQCDIVILRPNIEHEMLGVIMGRGGTQELGATFWGQTELSCYDDAQHGIWGMSYKYHERAMVTNERNMIRAYDVAFDGYNGGMDQTCVHWNDPESIKSFRDGTYDRSKPFNGPSMLVMALPTCENSKTTWPNPIVYHAEVGAVMSPDPEKSQGDIPNIKEHVVFNSQMNPRLATPAVQDKFNQYMSQLGMTQWMNADQSTRPAGESCIANETSSTPMAFQGSMRILNANGAQIEDIKGSGHLGHSYVGIASVREGRGVLNPAAQHSMMRLV